MAINLLHKLKSSSHTIPLDTEKILLPTAFKTVLVHNTASDSREHTAMEWVLPVAASHEGKYKDHQFVLEVTPDSLDALAKAIEWARGQFEKVGLPEGE